MTVDKEGCGNGDRIGMKRNEIRLIFLLLWSAATWGFDDLSGLSDEFDSAESLGNWARIYETEGWGNDALERIDIDTSAPGSLFMLPYTSSWYAEWRGELTYKEVTGDFVITTEVEPRNRAGSGAPQSLYSLAGIMVRTPRTMTNMTQWEPGLQNYVFLSLGAANQPGQYQFEVKTTVNSQSTLDITPGVERAQIQVARLGAHLIMLRREAGADWRVHRRYFRPDMMERLQAGLTVYTDWNICEQVGVEIQNTRVLTNGLALPDGGVLNGCNPDLAASFEFVRYRRPNIPGELAGANFSNPQTVSDVQLLSFLGENANHPGGAAVSPTVTVNRVDDAVVSIAVETMPMRSYRVQVSGDMVSWSTITNFVSSEESFGMEETAGETGAKFYRAVTP
jgi:hypothetical protein